jgi:hypothetical protein
VTQAVASPEESNPGLLRTLDVAAKAGLVLLLWVAIAYPDLGHLRGKAAYVRAVGYPVVAFVIPVLWWTRWRGRMSFPWLADLLVSITCFSDILGNRLDLYDRFRWFDDWMHLVNTGLLSAAVLILTLRRSAGRGAHLERALAFGVTAALAWEVAEYVSFVRLSSERIDAYADTLGDLTLGALGAVLAALVVHRLASSGRLTDPPVPRTRGLAAAHQ